MEVIKALWILRMSFALFRLRLNYWINSEGPIIVEAQQLSNLYTPPDCDKIPLAGMSWVGIGTETVIGIVFLRNLILEDKSDGLLLLLGTPYSLMHGRDFLKCFINCYSYYLFILCISSVSISCKGYIRFPRI